MIANYMCNKCNHECICGKMKALEKFDPDNKKFIGIDITMVTCNDFSPIVNETEKADKE